MKPKRFYPIENKEILMAAIKYVHLECFKLCHVALGKYLPVAGNLGIFCHDEKEYEFLTELGEDLTDFRDSLYGKYFRLYKPIVIPANDDIPETKYEYLYIRKPDELRPEVGDVDFIISENEFEKIRNSEAVNDISIFNRPDLGMCGLSSSDFDVLSFLTTKTITEVLGK